MKKGDKLSLINTKILEIKNEGLEVSVLKKLIKENAVRNDDISGNVLILSDRMLQASTLLGNYLESVTKMNFIGVISKLDDLKSVDEKIDYLIIYGYLEDYDNYNIIDELRKKNNKITTIFYAILSEVVKEDAKSKNIKFLFNRYAPLDMLLLMLERVFNHYDMDDKNGIKVDNGFEKFEFSEWLT